MKIRVVILAAALSGGAAFAAAPNDTAKAPADSDAKPAIGKSMAKDHKKMATKHHAMHHRADKMGASAEPSVDLNDQSRQSRMDDALSNYRKQRG